MSDINFDLGKKCLLGKLLTLCLIGSSFVITNVALAEYPTPTTTSSPNSDNTTTTATRYRKPTTTSSPNPDSTTTTTTRSLCSVDSDSNTEAVLTALAPYSHRGQTVSSHPTFAWFVPESNAFPIEFQLHEYDAQGNRTLKYKTEFTSKPGIMQLSLPLDQPGLLVGKAYRWQVAILCDRNHPSKDIIIRAELDVVASQPALESALNATNNLVKKAGIYAEFGLWYDAIATALSLPENTSRKNIVVNFLRQLIDLETEEGSKASQEQSTRLEQVIENDEF